MALIDPTALHLEPGDLVVLTLPDAMDWEDLDAIADAARETFPENKTIVLSPGMTLHAAGAAAIDRASAVIERETGENCPRYVMEAALEAFRGPA